MVSATEGSADLGHLLAEQRQQLEQAELDNRAATERVEQAEAAARAQLDQE